jgi:hypothetical protein
MMSQVASQTEIGKICSKQSPCSASRLSQPADTPSGALSHGQDPNLPCGRCATTRGLVAQCRKRSSSVNRRVHSCRGRADCADTKR